MARMFPASFPAHKGAPVAAAERLLFARLERALDAGWTVIHDCEVSAHGETGTIDFVLIHRGFGVALLGLAEPDDADPEHAVSAMRAMLDANGFSRRFPGRLAVAALTLPPDDKRDPRAAVEAAFAALPPSAIADPTWADWLIERLKPQAGAKAASETAAAPGLRLRPPDPDEAWRVAEAARARGIAQVGAAVEVTAEPILASAAAGARPTSWVGMALAVVVVSVVLIGMALLSHGNGAPLLADAPPISTG